MKWQAWRRISPAPWCWAQLWNCREFLIWNWFLNTCSIFAQHNTKKHRNRHTVFHIDSVNHWQTLTHRCTTVHSFIQCVHHLSCVILVLPASRNQVPAIQYNNQATYMSSYLNSLLSFHTWTVFLRAYLNWKKISDILPNSLYTFIRKRFLVTKKFVPKNLDTKNILQKIINSNKTFV